MTDEVLPHAAKGSGSIPGAEELYGHLIPEHLAEARNVVSFVREAAPTPAPITKPEPEKHPWTVPETKKG